MSREQGHELLDRGLDYEAAGRRLGIRDAVGHRPAERQGKPTEG